MTTRKRRWIPLAAALGLVAAATAVDEVEPNTFTLPQALGTLDAGGILVSATLDPTSGDGLDPADRDGFSFTLAEAGPFAATADDGSGRTFILALSEGEELLAAVLGPAPLTLARRGLEAGTTYRVGVAALSDGSPLPYALDLGTADLLPYWSGAEAGPPVAEVEPDDSASAGTDLGDFTRPLRGAGSLATVYPPGHEDGPGDSDWFRFRAILATPARLVVTADPGLCRVRVHELRFAAPYPILDASFGEGADLAVPLLRPGSQYFVEVTADGGSAPLDYQFFLEPASPPPPPPPAPLSILRARVPVGAGAAAAAYSLTATFQPGLGATLPSGSAFGYDLLGVGEEFGEGILRTDRQGRMRYRAPAGREGLRRFVLDPYAGRVRLRGRGLPLPDPGGNPAVTLSLEVGTIRLEGEAEGTLDGTVLKVR